MVSQKEGSPNVLQTEDQQSVGRAFPHHEFFIFVTQKITHQRFSPRFIAAYIVLHSHKSSGRLTWLFQLLVLSKTSQQVQLNVSDLENEKAKADVLDSSRPHHRSVSCDPASAKFPECDSPASLHFSLRQVSSFWRTTPYPQPLLCPFSHTESWALPSLSRSLLLTVFIPIRQPAHRHLPTLLTSSTLSTFLVPALIFHPMCVAVHPDVLAVFLPQAPLLLLTVRLVVVLPLCCHILSARSISSVPLVTAFADASAFSSRSVRYLGS